MASAEGESENIDMESDHAMVEGSIVTIIEGDPGSAAMMGVGATGAGLQGKTMVLNERTGEIEIIDLGDPTVSHEVEVVTVDTDRVFGNHQRAAPMRYKNPPSLLRHSRRAISQTSSGTLDNTILMAPANLPPASANFLKAARQQMAGTVINTTSNINLNSSIVTTSPQNNITMNSPISIASAGIQADGREQYVILTQSGTSPSEYNLVHGNFQSKLRELLIANDIKPSHNGQPTILICEDPNNEVAELVHEIDGTFVQAEQGDIVYHLDDSSMITLTEMQGGSDTMMSSGVSGSAKKKGKKIEDPDRVKKRSQTELKCMEKDCVVVCYNVGELRKHLATAHLFHFDEDIVLFDSDHDFKQWRECYERERMVSFIYRGGTKKIAKDQAVTYLICHRSGHYKPTMGDTSQRKRKMKPQGSCKMGGYCTAGIKLLKNLETGNVRMDICHTHYGHPLDSQAIPHLRVNPMLRKVILNKFEDGMSFNEVLEFIHHNPNGLEGLRLVDRRAVRNIFDQWKNPRRRSKGSKDMKDGDEMDPLEVEDILDSAVGISENLSEEPETSSLIKVKGPPAGTSTITLGLVEPVNDVDSAPPLLTSEADAENNQNEENVSSDPKSPSSDRKEMPKIGKGKDEGVSMPIDVSFIKEEPVDDENSGAVEEEEPAKNNSLNTSNSKGNYQLRPKKRSLAHLLMSKRGRRASQSGDEADASTESVETEKGNSPSKKREKRKKENIEIQIKEEKGVEKKKPQSNDPFVNLLPGLVPRAGTVEINQNIDICVEKLNKHGESGPTVLLYKTVGKIAPTYGDVTRGFRENDFCVVVQTPVQRQIMQMFPNIIGVEILEGKPDTNDLKLVFVMVLDDYREAIPVAWMVTDNVEARVLTNFFRVLRNECGELDSKYLMAPKGSDFYRLWCSTFAAKPKFIQNEFEVKKDLKLSVQHCFYNDVERKRAWSFVESLLTERSMTAFKKTQGRAKVFFGKLISGPDFFKSFEKNWLAKSEEWALSYRISAPVNTIFAADSFSKLKKFISFKGTKRLSQSIDHILKIGYDKCFLRSKRMFKGDQKHSQLCEEIKRRHDLSYNFKKDCVEPESENFHWTVKIPDENVTFQVSDVRSPCECKNTCKDCNICMHMYLCSCADFGNFQLMCEHIHLVHCYRYGIGHYVEPESITGDLEDGTSSGPGIESSAAFNVYDEGENDIPLSPDSPHEDNVVSMDIDDVLEAAGLLQVQQGQDSPVDIPNAEAATQAVEEESETENSAQKSSTTVPQKESSTPTLTLVHTPEKTPIVESVNTTDNPVTEESASGLKAEISTEKESAKSDAGEEKDAKQSSAESPSSNKITETSSTKVIKAARNRSATPRQHPYMKTPVTPDDSPTRTDTPKRRVTATRLHPYMRTTQSPEFSLPPTETPKGESNEDSEEDSSEAEVAAEPCKNKSKDTPVKLEKVTNVDTTPAKRSNIAKPIMKTLSIVVTPITAPAYCKVETSPSADSRRVSARLQKRTKRSDSNSESKKSKGSTRSCKSAGSELTSTKEAEPLPSSSKPKPTSSKRLRSKLSFNAKEQSTASTDNSPLKDKLLGLLSRVDQIQDSKVREQMEKIISDADGILKIGRSDRK